MEGNVEWFDATDLDGELGIWKSLSVLKSTTWLELERSVASVGSLILGLIQTSWVGIGYFNCNSIVMRLCRFLSSLFSVETNDSSFDFPFARSVESTKEKLFKDEYF